MRLSHGDQRPTWTIPLAVIAGVFGVATVASGGRVLFGPESARAAAGHYVPFVLWFNFLAGFAYMGAAVGIALARRWAPTLSLGIAVGTLLVFFVFGAHVLAGRAYEPRTVAAMTLRLGVWTAITVTVYRRRA